MPESVTKCPICGGLFYEGECYKCGAYYDDGKIVPQKPEPVRTPAAAPALPDDAPEPEPEDRPGRAIDDL